MERLERVLPAAQHLPPVSILPLLRQSDNSVRRPPLWPPPPLRYCSVSGGGDEVGAFQVGDRAGRYVDTAPTEREEPTRASFRPDGRLFCREHSRGDQSTTRTFCLLTLSRPVASLGRPVLNHCRSWSMVMVNSAPCIGRG